MEQENIRIAHVKDAKAMCRFIYWLKQNVGSGEVTEYSAAQKVRSSEDKIRTAWI